MAGKCQRGGTSIDHYKDLALSLHDGSYGRIVSGGVMWSGLCFNRIALAVVFRIGWGRVSIVETRISGVRLLQ